jgi:hypothetical protein
MRNNFNAVTSAFLLVMTGSAQILTADKTFIHSYCAINDSTVISQLAQLIAMRTPHDASRIKY